LRILIWLLSILTLAGCTRTAMVGSPENPLKIALTPGKEAQVLMLNGNKLRDFLKKDIDVTAEVSVPASYIAVVESLGSERTDVALLNTLGYLIANKRYEAHAIFTLTDRGRSSYKGQFIAHVDGPKSLAELNDKKMAYVDPISSSGYLLPKKLLETKGIKIKDSVFAGRHDSVVTMVYQKQVDAGATFWLPDEPNGRPYDARRLIETQFPDVFEKVKIIGYTQELPNEALVIRKGLSMDLQQKLKASLLKWISLPEGQVAMRDLYGCDGLKPATDADYDSARALFKGDF